MDKGLVSIVMLTRNSSQHVEESVKSVLMQTYTNWELLIIDDASYDDTIQKVSCLRGSDKRIRISQVVFTRGDTISINSLLREANGKWLAFLNAGDAWQAEKLEKQISFMKDNDYHFSYTRYGLIDGKSNGCGIEVGGKGIITHNDMLKCCWPAYLTVIYDKELVGLCQVKGDNQNYDYALWLDVSEKYDCFLLNEKLAFSRTNSKWTLPIFLRWRYDCFRQQKALGVLSSFIYALRNSFYDVWKCVKYVNKVEV